MRQIYEKGGHLAAFLALENVYLWDVSFYTMIEIGGKCAAYNEKGVELQA